MEPPSGPTVEHSFGPAVAFTALKEAGVRFHFVGLITHYACELCGRQRPANPVDDSDLPRSHAENRNRLALALRELGAVAQADDGVAEPFTGDGSALVGRQRFQTRHGDIYVSVRTPVADEEVPGMDAFSAGIRIVVTVPAARLRAYAATGKFPGLTDVLEIVELFDSHDERADVPRVDRAVPERPGSSR